MAEFTLHPQLAQDSLPVLDLPLSRLIMMNDSAYPWFVLVPRRAEITEIFQLDWEDQVQLLNESSMVSELLMQVFQGDKMNVAALGNMVPQLHLHHIVRFKNDPAWPGPVWGVKAMKAFEVQTANDLIADIKSKLNAIIQSK